MTTLNQTISQVVLVNRKNQRSLRVMCVLDISRMTSSRMTTRNGWSHQTGGLTDMSRLTNEDTDVARLANEVTDVAHLIHVSIDDARLIMAKADNRDSSDRQRRRRHE